MLSSIATCLYILDMRISCVFAQLLAVDSEIVVTIYSVTSEATDDGTANAR